MAKAIFVLHRKPGTTREECVAYWGGDVHTALVKKVPGLTRWVQNRVLGGPSESQYDGIGELWFESDTAMQKALSSGEFAAAVEDAKNFLDMDRTGMILVEEKTVIG